MTKYLVTPRFWVLASMITAAALSRLLPHPPNFAPIAAMALFGGAYFSDKKLAVIVPLLSLLLSDAVIHLLYGWGFYEGMQFVYFAFVVIVFMGFMMRKQVSSGRVAAATLCASVWFFLFTNFAVWLGSSFYPQNLSGLILCYEAAIPFFHWTVLGDAVYASLLFGGFALARSRYPVLQEPLPAMRA